MSDILGSPYSKNSYKVLLLGGGELGKELVIELHHLGVETHVFDNNEYSPAGQVSHYSKCINMLDYDILKENIKNVKPHYIIPEIESLNIKVLKDLELEGYTILPNANTIEITMNRKNIRDLAENICKCKTTKYEYASSENELLTKINIIGLPCVIKPLMSSSGKGQTILKNIDEYKNAWLYAIENSRGNINEVIIEEFLPFDYEFTLMTIFYNNNICFLEPIIHIQENGDYLISYQPLKLDNILLEKAKSYCKTIVNTLCSSKDKGIFGFEFFVKNDIIYFNEVAPRPHDTAMVTLSSQLYSQFSIYSRIICNQPLPDMKVYFPSASHAIVMTNETNNPIFKLDNINNILKNINVNIRIFGKTSVKKKRRMGILLLKNDSYENSINILKTYIKNLLLN